MGIDLDTGRTLTNTSKCGTRDPSTESSLNLSPLPSSSSSSSSSPLSSSLSFSLLLPLPFPDSPTSYLLSGYPFPLFFSVDQLLLTQSPGQPSFILVQDISFESPRLPPVLTPNFKKRRQNQIDPSCVRCPPLIQEYSQYLTFTEHSLSTRYHSKGLLFTCLILATSL